MVKTGKIIAYLIPILGLVLGGTVLNKNVQADEKTTGISTGIISYKANGIGAIPLVVNQPAVETIRQELIEQVFDMNQSAPFIYVSDQPMFELDEKGNIKTNPIIFPNNIDMNGNYVITFVPNGKGLFKAAQDSARDYKYRSTLEGGFDIPSLLNKAKVNLDKSRAKELIESAKRGLDGTDYELVVQGTYTTVEKSSESGLLIYTADKIFPYDISNGTAPRDKVKTIEALIKDVKQSALNQINIAEKEIISDSPAIQKSRDDDLENALTYKFMTTPTAIPTPSPTAIPNDVSEAKQRIEDAYNNGTNPDFAAITATNEWLKNDYYNNNKVYYQYEIKGSDLVWTKHKY